MDKTKIGIVTLYYKSLNYGGNLQAWALCQYLNANGYDAEQIQYKNIATTYRKKVGGNSFDNGTKQTSKVATVLRLIKDEGIIGGIKSIIKILKVKKDEKRRADDAKKTDFQNKKEQAFREFNEQKIPHSRAVYDDANIEKCVEDYDVFIAGSDQVWNMQWYSPTFFLEFVSPYKKKISYAASMAMNGLSDAEEEKVGLLLKDYFAISVREGKTKELLEGICSSKIEQVVDPVLLLRKEDWDEICAERVVPDRYLFCYFLGTNKKERALAKKFAKKNKLKLVHIPFGVGDDCNFGDRRLIDVTPEQFISLIKYAEYIFTDSFHATAFSHIYQKQYFIFNRSEKGEMSSRITDITDLFETTERFCAGKERENYKYICSLLPIDYNRRCEKFEKRKQESIEFLQKNLQK